MAGQRLDQVIGEDAHAAVGAQIRTLPRPGTNSARRGPRLRPAAYPSDFPAGRKSDSGTESLLIGSAVGQRALDRHPGRVAAVEHHQQAARRQLGNIGGEGHRGERAAADASQA
ncbi:MAG: hypothetical protein V5B36_13165 [Candidatus Accumulibacter sp. UW25]